MKKITLFNNKGGVGKTTSVINIAYEMYRAGRKVVVIDLDGQQNTSRFFSDVEVAETVGTSDEALANGVSPTIMPTRYENIGIITAGNSTNKNIQHFLNLSEETQMKNVQLLVKDTEPCDYIIFDLPPALNGLTTSILKICDKVFVPIELGTFAIQGIVNVTDTISRSGTSFGGCFATKYDRRNPVDLEVLELLQNNLDTSLFKTKIPNSKVIKNSISYRLTAPEYMHWTYAAGSYTALTKELLTIMEGE